MATSSRQIKLGAFLMQTGHHIAAWRHPQAQADAGSNFRHYVELAKLAEAAKFDAVFLADSVGVRSSELASLSRTARSDHFEPLTLLSALAAVTERIGLIATVSTSFNEPFNVARKFASLDQISGGRSGWNLVTSSGTGEAQNFNRDEHFEHALRYERAAEFHDVVTGLWDSWADDAFVRDVDSGRFFDPAKLHVLAHKGEHLSVRGPLHIARPVQGWPVIVQAGASEAGRQLAAETAELIFAAPGTLANARAFYADVKSRMRKLGRDPEHLKILPGAFTIVADSVDEAKAIRAKLDSLVHYDSAIASLSIALGHDASSFDPDGPLPEVPPTNASQSGRERVIELARRENLTVRQLAQRLGGYGGLAFVGTARTIADEMQEWLESEGSDGFNVMFPWLPGGLDAFVDRVVPELQRRGIFRQEYEGRTLRENLGLPRPVNRFFSGN